MTFDAFLTFGRPTSAGWRRVTYALSLALHGALLLVGVAASFWRVEEVSPSVQIPTFLAPFVPPSGSPPPPARRPPARPHVRAPALVQPRPAEAPAPTEPTPATDDLDPPGENPGRPGVGPGVDQISHDWGSPPRMVGPHVAQAQLAIDPHVDPYRVRLPAALISARFSLTVLVKICVRATGDVDSVTVLRSNEPTLNATVVSVLHTWRYRPFTIDGRPVPFCSTVNYQITPL
jgi:TonB family protein